MKKFSLRSNNPPLSLTGLPLLLGPHVSRSTGSTGVSSHSRWETHTARCTHTIHTAAAAPSPALTRKPLGYIPGSFLSFFLMKVLLFHGHFEWTCSETHPAAAEATFSPHPLLPFLFLSPECRTRRGRGRRTQVSQWSSNSTWRLRTEGSRREQNRTPLLLHDFTLLTSWMSGLQEAVEKICECKVKYRNHQQWTALANTQIGLLICLSFSTDCSSTWLQSKYGSAWSSSLPGPRGPETLRDLQGCDLGKTDWAAADFIHPAGSAGWKHCRWGEPSAVRDLTADICPVRGWRPALRLSPKTGYDLICHLKQWMCQSHADTSRITAGSDQSQNN